jgi:hypothetical protein
MPKKPDKPVEFISVNEAFKPQIEVRATRDFNGWVDRERRIKWTISKGSIGYLDIDKAREFQVKGYVDILQGHDLIAPVSDDERAEIMSTVQVIGVNKNG